MDSALYWIGVAHVALYTGLGTSALSIWALNLTCRRMGIAGAIILTYGRVLRERREAASQRR